MVNVLIIGAYGNFGSIITEKLINDPGIKLFLAGRDSVRLAAMAARYLCEYVAVDAKSPEFGEYLKRQKIDLVIHTGGPYQGQDLSVPLACIEAGANYCDLADCRHFVGRLTTLDQAAREKGVSLLSGCSSVPTLASSVMDHYASHFQKIEVIDYGITSSAKMPGIATVQGVLGNAGKPIPRFLNGVYTLSKGWTGLHLKKLPQGIGWRILADVDVPDIDVFPTRYGANTVWFRAGGGLKSGMLFNYLAARAAQLGLIESASGLAKPLHRLGSFFSFLGDGRSAMYIDIKGVDHNGSPLSASWQITATDDMGPTIPACGSVALARKMANGWRPSPGAGVCVGVVTMEEYLDAVGAKGIHTQGHLTHG